MISKKVHLFIIILSGTLFLANVKAAKTANITTSKAYIKNALHILKVSNNLSIRLKTIKSLASFKDKKVLEPLLYALDDKSAFVRINAIRILAKLKYFQTINPLIRRLRVEPELFVQRELILTLGKIKDQKARWIIKPFLKNKSVLLKRAAKKALNMINSK